MAKSHSLGKQLQSREIILKKKYVVDCVIRIKSGTFLTGNLFA
jgi:hypothetical protein